MTTNTVTHICIAVLLCIILLCGIFFIPHADAAADTAIMDALVSSSPDESWLTPVSQPAPVSEPASNDVDLITNVVAHEVGGISGGSTYVVITYADGTTYTYNGGCILHKIHARVLQNQANSSLFQSDLSACIKTYWASYLADPWYFSRSNPTWQHCREDVVSALNGEFTIPSNVLAATCDPNFASYYPGYSLYAAVYWNTGWYSGTFYYYQYN